MINQLKKNKFTQKLTILNNNEIEVIANFYSFNLTFKSGVLQKIEIEFSVDAGKWLLINEKNLFNIQNTIFNNEEEFDLNPNKPIELICFINPNELEKLEVNDPEEFNKLFNNVSFDYCDNSKWFIDKILQNEEIPSTLHGNLKMGFSTNWRELHYPNNQFIKSELFQDIFLFFSSSFYNLTIITENERFRWDLSGQIPNSVGEILFKAELKQLIFYINIPFNLASNKMNKLINEINFDLPIGNFEYLENPPNLRFKTSIDFLNVDLTYSMLQNLYQANIMICKKYHTEFLEQY